MREETLHFVSAIFSWVVWAAITAFVVCAIYGVVTGATFQPPEHTGRNDSENDASDKNPHSIL